MSAVNRSRGRFLAVLLLIVVIGACGKSRSKTTEPEVPVPPTPDSPRNALALLEYSWEQRSVESYRNVFTADYQFDFAPSDSANGVVISRDGELAFANHLFVTGTAGHPPATSIYFSLDPNLVFGADDRPGRNPRWHQRVTSYVRVNVNTSGTDYSVLDHGIFYLTRGDSAQIPAELVTAGVTPDSTRWFVDHWTDDTFCPDTKTCTTIGRIKIAYGYGAPVPDRRR